MADWEREFEIHWTFLAAQWMRPYPNPPRARFSLKSEQFTGRCYSSSAKRYRVMFNQSLDPHYGADDMCCFWSGVWLTEAAGTVALPPIHDLPPWDGGEDEPDWKNALETIHQRLIGGADYPRLVGYMPVLGNAGNARVDQVQMVLLNQALTDPNTRKKTDLLLVSMQYADGAQEDGAASGPPR